MTDNFSSILKNIKQIKNLPQKKLKLKKKHDLKLHDAFIDTL